MDRHIAQVAETQLGLVTHGQSLGAGLSDEAIEWRVRTGRWQRRHRGVYAVTGLPRSWEQDLMAACLAGGSGAVASHRSAAGLWAFDGIPRGFVEISVARPLCHRLTGVVVHRSTDLVRSASSTRAGIPVTSPMRTLVDLGAVMPSWAVETALDHVLSRRLVTVAGVRRELDVLARKGRRGAGVLRALLDCRGDACLRTDSVLEARMLRICREHGLPLPVTQYEIRVGGRLLARVDFAFPEIRLAIEVDGYEHHASLGAFQHDRTRQNDLVAAGWTVLRFTWDDVTRHPERVAAHILRVLGALSRVQHG